jgi:hypothetical protein
MRIPCPFDLSRRYASSRITSTLFYDRTAPRKKVLTFTAIPGHFTQARPTAARHPRA